MYDLLLRPRPWLLFQKKQLCLTLELIGVSLINISMLAMQNNFQTEIKFVSHSEHHNKPINKQNLGMVNDLLQLEYFVTKARSESHLRQ